MNSVFHGIGLMSGTSLDGLDIVYCRFEKTDHRWNYSILKYGCISFPKTLYNKLKSAPNLTSIALLKLDIQFGNWVGKQVSSFINQHHIKPQFIAAHGYTVFHQPENGFTHQIGCGEEIYSLTKVPVINNFRQSDVSLGGQGAPLVPIGDQLLFKEFNICLNLGGIANLSFEEDNKRFAYDICPVNIVLNYLARKKMKSFDEGGKMAKSGSIIPAFLDELESLDYYKMPYPKSLGVEWVNEYIFKMHYFQKNSPEDLAHTFVKHIANRIKHACMAIEFKDNEKSLLLTGGGSHNDFLTESIKSALKGNFNVIKPSDELINYKEALIFAFLGLLRLKGETNILKSVTGASRDNIGGHILGGSFI